MSRARSRSPLIDRLEGRQLLSIVRAPTSGPKPAVIEQVTPLVPTSTPVDPLAGLSKGTHSTAVTRSTSTGAVAAIRELAGGANIQFGAAVGRSPNTAGTGPGRFVLPAMIKGGVARSAGVASTILGNVHLPAAGHIVRAAAAAPAAPSLASEIAALRGRINLHTIAN